jgi:DNA-binding transcriptional LysR family regulator
VREPWRKDELVLVGAPGIDASTAPLVTFAHGMTTRAIVDQRFADRPIAMELGSIAAVKANTRAGVGIALVSRASIQRELDAGQLVIVPSERTPITRSLHLVHRGRERLPPAASALLELLRASK